MVGCWAIVGMGKIAGGFGATYIYFYLYFCRVNVCVSCMLCERLYLIHVLCCKMQFTVLLFWWLIWWNMRGWAQLKQTISSRRLDPKQPLILVHFVHSPIIIWAAIQKMQQGRTNWSKENIGEREEYYVSWLNTYYVACSCVIFVYDFLRWWEPHDKSELVSQT